MTRDLPTVTLFGRAGCHLCSEARLLLHALAPALGFAVEEVDIDLDGTLLAAYDTAVPVVAIAGQEVTRAPLRPTDLRRRLEAVLMRTTPPA